MGVGALDVHGQTGHVAAQTHGAAPRGVDGLFQLLFHFGQHGVGVALAHGPGDGVFGQFHDQVGGAAQTHADDARRAGIGAAFNDRVQNEFLHGLDAVLRVEHFHLAHVLRAGALGNHQNVQIRAVPVKVEVGHGQAGPYRGLGIDPGDGVGGAAAEGEFLRGALGPFIEGGLDFRAVPGVGRTDAHLVDGQARVLAEQGLLAVRDFNGLEHGLENAAGSGLGFPVIGLFQGRAHVGRQVAERLDVALLGRFFHDGVIKGIHTEFLLRSRTRQPRRRPVAARARSARIFSSREFR